MTFENNEHIKLKKTAGVLGHFAYLIKCLKLLDNW